MKRFLFPFLCIAVFCSAGCGDDLPERVPVSGQVLIDGEPLRTGYIRFISSGARPSTGKIGEDGRFTLGCFEADDGAVIGTHRVEVSAQEPLSETQTKWYAPKQYAAASTSGLTQEIAEPTDSLVINLTWDGQAGPFVEHVE